MFRYFITIWSYAIIWNQTEVITLMLTGKAVPFHNPHKLGLEIKSSQSRPTTNLNLTLDGTKMKANINKKILIDIVFAEVTSMLLLEEKPSFLWSIRKYFPITTITETLSKFRGNHSVDSWFLCFIILNYCRLCVMLNPRQQAGSCSLLA